MTAARKPKTPTMAIPLRDNVSEKSALRLTRDFSRLTLLELISGDRGISVTEKLEQGGAGEWIRSYYVTMKFHPAKRIRQAFGLSLDDVASIVGRNFLPLLSTYMKQELRRSAVEADVIGGEATTFVKKGGATEDEDDQGGQAEQSEVRFGGNRDEADEEDDDEGDANDEDGADAARTRRRANSESYDEESGEEESVNEQQRPRPSSSPVEDEEAEIPQTTLIDKSMTGPVVNERANSISVPPLQVDPVAPPLLMVGLVEKAAANTMVRSRKGIEQAFLNTHEGTRRFETLGVNIGELWKLDFSMVDHDRLESNDIWALRCAYGVEAARSNIVHQITSVFGAYGIEVNARHLSLIADYMTADGGYKAMNRLGMESSSSPFLQMSFETTAHFLKQAAMANDSDTLSSPSGNIVMGRPVLHGTGAFDLLTRTD